MEKQNQVEVEFQQYLEHIEAERARVRADQAFDDSIINLYNTIQAAKADWENTQVMLQQVNDYLMAKEALK